MRTEEGSSSESIFARGEGQVAMMIGYIPARFETFHVAEETLFPISLTYLTERPWSASTSMPSSLLLLQCCHLTVLSSVLAGKVSPHRSGGSDVRVGVSCFPHTLICWPVSSMAKAKGMMTHKLWSVLCIQL